MLTKKELESYFNLKKKFDERLNHCILLEEEAKTGRQYYIGLIDTVRFKEGRIKIRTAGNNDFYQEVNNYYDLPEDCLYSDEWEKDVRKRIESREQEKRE